MINATKHFGDKATFQNMGAILRYLAQNAQHASERTPETVYLPNPERHGNYWLRDRAGLRITDDEYARLYRVAIRYRAFCRHMREIDPEWVNGDKTHYADNSVVVTQHSAKYPGLTRRETVEYPSGDACY